jgi:glyoxylase-like metal-dependent hydrolase (beta-lactamase superfamily II)
MFPNVSEAVLDEAAARFGPDAFEPQTRSVVLSIHSYVLRVGERLILVDSLHRQPQGAAGNARNAPPQHELSGRPCSRGVRPEDVDLVLCTHLHPDHVGWNTRLADGRWVPTFPNARYLIGRTEFENANRLRGLPPIHEMAADLQTMFDDSRSSVPISSSSSTTGRRWRASSITAFGSRRLPAIRLDS